MEGFDDFFKNFSSALNYVGHAIFAATWARCNLSVVDDHFKSWQIGMRRKKTSRNEVVKHASFLLTTSMVTQVVKYFDAIEHEEAAMLTIQCWQEFSGVQSEGVEALAGDHSQALALKDGVESAVWVERFKSIESNAPINRSQSIESLSVRKDIVARIQAFLPSRHDLCIPKLTRLI